MSGLDDLPITLVGHPYARIGMGEQLRSHLRALQAVHLSPTVLDIYRHAGRDDPAHEALIAPVERRDAPPGLRIFHVNGDEVARVLDTFADRGGVLEAGVNVIVPAWELPRYPALWVPGLRRFDEVWAISRFVHDSLAAAAVESHIVGQSVETAVSPALPRRFFGIRESAFVLLHFLDLSSFAARKNPQGAIDLLAGLAAARAHADLMLVVKVKEADRAAAAWADSFAGADGLRGAHLKVIDTPLDSLATRSLIRACDCFVSLHRAEGFGRGLGEAMALGRLAMGTGWSGNLDFMTAGNSLLVNHRLMRVKRDAYPHAAGQSWAEPDLAHAAALLADVLDDPAHGRAVAERGRLEVLASHGDRAVGLRLLARLEALAARMPARRPRQPRGVQA